MISDDVYVTVPDTGVPSLDDGQYFVAVRDGQMQLVPVVPGADLLSLDGDGGGGDTSSDTPSSSPGGSGPGGSSSGGSSGGSSSVPSYLLSDDEWYMDGSWMFNPDTGFIMGRLYRVGMQLDDISGALSRPALTTDFSDYSVSECLLLLILFVLFCRACATVLWRGFKWLF